jgi:integrase
MINKTRVKTKAQLTVPVVPALQIILDKYWKNGQPLPKISNQKGNEYLKEIGKKMSLTRSFNYVQQQARKTDEKAYEAWEMLSFHTARHSFITNCIQLGILPEAVRQIVGHKSFKMLSKYIQNDPEFLRKEMKKLTK